MEIKASVTYSPIVEKATWKFSRYWGKKEKSKFLKLVVICVLISSVVIPIGFALRSPLVEILGMFPLFYLLRIFVSYSINYLIELLRIKTRAKREKDLYVPTYYTFFDDYFRIEKNSEVSQSKQEVKYVELSLVLESSDFFWLVMEKRGGNAVDKATFQGGPAEDLRSIISSYLGEKYVKLND